MTYERLLQAMDRVEQMTGAKPQKIEMLNDEAIDLAREISLASADSDDCCTVTVSEVMARIEEGKFFIEEVPVTIARFGMH